MFSDNPGWQWLLKKIGRKIWFRTVSFAVLGVMGALIAAPIAALMPSEIAQLIDPGALSDILRILASSMLIVATFSLSNAISAYAAASAATTPRVTELLMQDPTAQNAISTFVGGFLFSLAGFIGLGAGIYGENGHVALFALTLIVIAVIVVTFLRWVDLLSSFGRVGDAIDRTASAATKAIAARIERPCLGGRSADKAFDAGHPIRADESGYIQFINMEALQGVAEAIDGELRVSVLPGDFVLAGESLAEATFAIDDDCLASVHEAFDISNTRTYDQDPAQGISALAEIGIKALSPSVNDPVTAIRVIDRLTGILYQYANPPAEKAKRPQYDRLFVRALSVADLFETAFAQFALYGAEDVRVGVALQRALASLSNETNADCADAARHQARRALELARAKLVLEEDFARLQSINDSAGAAQS